MLVKCVHKPLDFLLQPQS